MPDLDIIKMQVSFLAKEAAYWFKNRISAKKGKRRFRQNLGEIPESESYPSGRHVFSRWISNTMERRGEKQMIKKTIQQAAEDLSRAKNAVALTGAGISVESGIPPFRGKGGVWETIDPKYALIDTFIADPKAVWEILIRDMKGLLDKAKPNPAHLGLFALEEMGILKTVITQNIDGLHQKAGNSEVIEFHGNCAFQRCMDCSFRIETEKVDLAELPPKCTCGGVLRPDWVFFGEAISEKEMFRSREVAAKCDLMLVVGTSAVVQPAAYMPVIAKQSGAKVIEINPEPTPLTGHVSDYIVQGPAGEVLEEIIALIHQKKDAETKPE